MSYFAGLINNNEHNLRLLVNTIIRLLNPAMSAFPAVSSNYCGKNSNSCVDPFNLPKCLIQLCYLSLIRFPQQISLI